ncbi:MAG: polyribonucleotide nucleotidyltransferase, partial [Planctomycetota bacterium]
MTDGHVRVEREIAGVRLAIETGQVARQAGGSVIVTLGDSRVFAAVTAGSAREDIDFFPLFCDYREKTEAGGKIPGGFFKREGRPTTKETLTMRMIDRSIRPMFPDGYKQDVQVLTQALQYDGKVNTDVAAMIAGFAAIRISGLPFETTLGAVRIGHIDGELVVWPDDSKRRTESRLDLVVAGHKDGLAMVESSAKELTEEELIDALDLAGRVILEVVELIDELKQKAGKPEIEFVPAEVNESLKAKVFEYEERLSAVIRTDGKHQRDEACRAVRTACITELTEGCPEGELKSLTKEIKEFFHDLQQKVERGCILGGKRVDGRAS